MNGIDNIFEDDLGFETEPEVITNTQDVNTDNDNFFDDSKEGFTTEDSVWNTYLESKGFKNSMIRIVDEDQVEKDINFYDLSREEQLEILNSNESSSTENLDDSEISLINHLRTNNLSVEEFLSQYRESIIAEGIAPAEPSYDIDAYDDQELYLLDLKNKYDLTDDELGLELEKELKNEELFNKKVTKIRSEYKLLEDKEKASKQAEFEALQQEEYNKFAQTMSGIANSVADFHGVFLEDNEKRETLSYLLEIDDSGYSQFSRDLNDPKKLYEAAWYLKYGKEAFEALESAYEAEILKLKKKDSPVVVQNFTKSPKHIDDLYT